MLPCRLPGSGDRARAGRCDRRIQARGGESKGSVKYGNGKPYGAGLGAEGLGGGGEELGLGGEGLGAGRNGMGVPFRAASACCCVRLMVTTGTSVGLGGTR